MAPGRKTGGRVAGISFNKPKPIILAPTEENREMVAMGQAMRTPKAVMLDTMLHFEALGRGFLSRAERMMAKGRTDSAKIAATAQEGHKYLVAAVECAAKVAPFVHARLLAIESRGDMTEERAPFVIRAPAVIADSSAWQAAASGAIAALEAQNGQNLPVVRQNEATAAPQALGPKTAIAPVSVVLGPDQKTNRITVMRPGPRIAQPSGTAEWLASVKKVG